MPNSLQWLDDRNRALNLTPAGRIKAPSRFSCVERILAAWESLRFQKEGPQSNGREEFTERAAAFYAVLGQGAPVDENNPIADLQPAIFEEERDEIVVHEG